MTAGRMAGNVASAIVGALVGAAVMLAVDGMTRTPTEVSSPQPRRPAVVATTEPVESSRSSTTFLAWSPGGLPANTERALKQIPGVRRATTVVAGLDWIRSSRAPDGTLADDPPAGFSIPFEIAVVHPRRYAAFVPPADRAAVLALRPGEALLAQTAAELRGASEGLRIALAGHVLQVAGVVSDGATGGYEAIVRGPVPGSWSRTDHFALIDAVPRARARIERRIRARLQPGQTLRVRSKTETAFLRYGDAVLPQMIVKQRFGEFAAQPVGDGSIVVDPAWKGRNIAARDVPILGRVTCHRALFQQMRGALREIAAEGLAYLIDRDDFAGCYSPRFIDARPGGRLSHHSWGIAFDINVSENAFGARPGLDRRIVEVMESWGFTWGGRWLVPDGMHFEWATFP